MARLLITGANGFVGNYAAAAFAAAGYEVVRAGHGAQPLDMPLDLRDEASIASVVAAARPDVVLHLAAQSFVPAAIADPQATYEINVMGTARLLQALRQTKHRTRVLYVSSAEVYGKSARTVSPLIETTLPLPANPYAASKIAAEHVALAERGDLLDIVIARPFNHIGPGQDARFVVAGFAAQIAAILGGAEPVLAVGNLEAERDFLDVRDVVQAYIDIVRDGVDGETYNVASGTPVPIREVLRRLLMLADMPITVRADAARMRPSDVPCFVGNAEKLHSATGWRPTIELDTSLAEILTAARSEVSATA